MPVTSSPVRIQGISTRLASFRNNYLSCQTFKAQRRINADSTLPADQVIYNEFNLKKTLVS